MDSRYITELIKRTKPKEERMALFSYATHNLKECPADGKQPSLMQENVNGKDIFFCQCERCLFRSTFAETEAKAILAWQRKVRSLDSKDIKKLKKNAKKNS